MNFPIPKDSTTGLVLSALFGLIFGVLLNKGRVSEYNVIVNLFRLKDFTVLKIMLTAIIVGGLGVFIMMNVGILHEYHIKPTNLLGIILGSGVFGVGMVLYGYCPGTAIAAVAAGRLHALVGFLGMLVGGIAYALSYTWVKANILSVGQFGKVRLSDVTGISAGIWWILLTVISAALFYWLEKRGKSDTPSK